MDLEPLLRYWTLQSPEGSLVTCELVRTAGGLEVRCDWKGEGAQGRVGRVAPIAAVTEALALAETWKAAYLDEGWVVRARRYPRRVPSS